jgi:integrase
MPFWPRLNALWRNLTRRQRVRRAFATLLKGTGEDVKTVEELMRHANSRLTLDVTVLLASTKQDYRLLGVEWPELRNTSRLASILSGKALRKRT